MFKNFAAKLKAKSIVAYLLLVVITQSGLTLSTATDGSDKVTTITAGTGTVSFS